MRRLSISPLVLITAVLALLLIAYVFSGVREPPTSDVRCSSRGSLDLVKAELFRRAAAVPCMWFAGPGDKPAAHLRRLRRLLK